jgi:hypothetical protein
VPSEGVSGAPGRSRRPAGTPPAWPDGLPPPEADGWERAAQDWLLDQCPPEYRLHEVLRRHPVVLARLTRWHVAAGIDGHTRALGLVRAELVGVVPPEGVDATVALLERELHRLRTLLPQVTAVDAALRGRRHRLRL